MGRIFAQGDVLLIEVENAPKGREVGAESGRLILARGEATGHHHSVIAGPCASLIRDIEDRELFLLLGEDATLEHQEHAAIELSAGTYQIVIQSEYAPEAIRNVAD